MPNVSQHDGYEALVVSVHVAKDSGVGAAIGALEELEEVVEVEEIIEAEKLELEGPWGLTPAPKATKAGSRGARPRNPDNRRIPPDLLTVEASPMTLSHD